MYERNKSNSITPLSGVTTMCTLHSVQNDGTACPRKNEPLSVTNQVGSESKQSCKLTKEKKFSDELISGTADWSDTTNTLNNTVKHLHWCVVINKDKEESSWNN